MLFIVLAKINMSFCQDRLHKSEQGEVETMCCDAFGSLEKERI